MRDKLAPYLSQYVLCKGWIDDWEKIEDENYRVLIKQTTIKEPNKNVLFDDLKLISVEHHINLFLNPDDVKDGTFTITNIGVFESLTGTAIINQPQLGIIAFGSVRKLPRVIETNKGDFI